MAFLSATATIAFIMVWAVWFLCWNRRYDHNFWLTCQHLEEIRCIIPIFLAGIGCVTGLMVRSYLDQTSLLRFTQVYWWVLLLTFSTMPVMIFSFQPFLKSKLHE
jgi:hypothetical protein